MTSSASTRAAGRPAPRQKQPSGTPAYASASGAFTDASPEKVAQLGQHYLDSKRSGLTQSPAGKVSRVGAKDLAVNFETARPAELEAMRAQGAEELAKAYCFTSGAGLWSRGGGQVKATVPFNLAELATAEELATLFAANDLLKASSPADVLLISRTDVRAGQTVEETAARVTSGARRQIDDLLRKITSGPQGLRALNPLVMKFVQMARSSERAGTYIPFDVWTSPQTHDEVYQFNQALKADFEQRPFHPEQKVQAQIVGALREYFTEADRVGDTHVFGWQVGLPALDPKTGAPILDTPRIGEGAGQAKAYLDQSGRTEELLGRGKETFVFENIEVLNDLPLLFGAHARAGKDVSVVLVPQRDGYEGGNPFHIEKPDGSTNLELHEQSALPPEFASGNAYFNSNTIVQPLKAEPPQNIGYEIKNNGTQVRAKVNAGDITQELPTAALGGRIGVEYENLKSYPDYAKNGGPLIDTHRSLWANKG